MLVERIRSLHLGINRLLMKVILGRLSHLRWIGNIVVDRGSLVRGRRQASRHWGPSRTTWRGHVPSSTPAGVIPRWADGQATGAKPKKQGARLPFFLLQLELFVSVWSVWTNRLPPPSSQSVSRLWGCIYDTRKIQYVSG